MPDRGDRRRRASSLLATHDLPARRAPWQRRRARRRVVWSAMLLTAAGVVIIAALTTSGSSGSRSGVTVASRVPVPDPDHAARHRPQHRATAARTIERVLAYTSYIRLGSGRRREVALTFDDGPGPYTPQVLRVLRRTHTPATLFVIGRWARAYPRLVAAEVAAGCEVGDHTQDHPPLALLSASAQTAELAAAARAIDRAGASYPMLMRPPYGSFDPATLGVLRALRMLMVLWSVDTKDYERPGVARIIYTAVSGAQPGAIILMHDGGGDRAETVAALPRIIARLRERRFRLVTISQLLEDDPPPANQPPPRPLAGRF